MIELTDQTTANATRRARKQHVRVSRISDTEIAATCANEAHEGGHVCRFERRADGSLWGECILRATGELCPAAIGRHVCYHLSSAVLLFIALEQGVGRATELCADGQVEKAVMFDEPLPAPDRWAQLSEGERVTAIDAMLGYAKPAPRPMRPA
jgi:hypothetical protein